MATTLSNKRITKVTYDYSVSGGAQSTITLDGWLPANCMVTNVYCREVTNITGASATLKLVCGSVDLTGAELGTDIVTAEQALASSATAIYISTAGQLKVTIGSAAVTAGKLEYFVEWVDND